MKILMREAEGLVPVKRAALYRHAKEGKFTTSKNAQGKTTVDVAELERYYGTLNTNGNEAHNGTGETDETAEMDGNGQVETTAQTQEIIELLKSQLADTKSELADAKSREKQLLSMLETEQEKTKMLMLAPPPQNQRPEKKEKSPSIWGYFRLRR